MSTVGKSLIRSVIAAAALEGGRFVKLDGAGKLVYCGAGELALGVLDDDVELGRSGDVILDGVGRVQCAAALARGALIASDANGRAVAATASAYVLGRLFGPARAPVSSTYDRAEVIINGVPHQIPAP